MDGWILGCVSRAFLKYPDCLLCVKMCVRLCVRVCLRLCVCLCVYVCRMMVSKEGTHPSRVKHH